MSWALTLYWCSEDGDNEHEHTIHRESEEAIEQASDIAVEVLKAVGCWDISTWTRPVDENGNYLPGWERLQ